jgi:hypothetical protein
VGGVLVVVVLGVGGGTVPFRSASFISLLVSFVGSAISGFTDTCKDPERYKVVAVRAPLCVAAPKKWDYQIMKTAAATTVVQSPFGSPWAAWQMCLVSMILPLAL